MVDRNIKLMLQYCGLIYVRNIPFQLQRVQLLAIGKEKQTLMSTSKEGAARITTKRDAVQW